jgi:hypothetical protein
VDLNLPHIDALERCENLLIAGMGGGFDIFCGLPIYFELRRRGRRPHLANFSFADVESIRDCTRLSETLIGVEESPEQFEPYFPEYYLAKWFRERRDEAITLWCFHKTGAAPLLQNYKRLLDHLAIDGILLVDGGVDSLMRGDEAQTGTLLEDAISLYVVNELREVKTRVIACVALGAERDVTHAHVFENMAGLTAAGGFLGACALAPQMPAYQAFEDAVLYVQGQRHQDPSVINSSVISSVRGNFGDYHLTAKTRDSRLWISPLMSIYWFFGLNAVAQRNLFLPYLAGTQTFREALFAFMDAARQWPRRSLAKVPL